MGKDLEERIRQEIARRAFEKADLKGQLAEAGHTIDVLEEMTGLSRADLETIEKEVRDNPPQEPDTFFSLKHQLIIAGMVLLLVVVLFLL